MPGGDLGLLGAHASAVAESARPDDRNLAPSRRGRHDRIMRARPRIATALGLFALGSVGCKVPDDDPLSIGRFAVEASRSESCGEEVALASPPNATFQVFLRKTSEQTILWNDGRERWPLIREDEATFVGETRVTIALDPTEPVEPSEPDLWDPDPEPEPEGAGCVMQRLDSLAIELFDEAFEGSLTHAFGAAEDSDCSAFMAPPLPLADSLPCTVRYDLEAHRID